MIDKLLVILVMVHGIMGWGDSPEAKQDFMRLYFYGVQPFLQREYGSEIRLVMVAPTLPRTDSAENRGMNLKTAIDQELKKWPPGTRVHIVAHSMGGLDARWVIVQDGMADKIASLTTIATPHRGTTLGDVAYDELPILLPAGKVLDRVYQIRRRIWRTLPFTRAADHDHLAFFNQMLLGFDSPPDKLKAGVHALTIEGAAAFNNRIAAAERSIRSRSERPVAYFAYGGVPGRDRVPLLVPMHQLIETWGTSAERTWGDPQEHKVGNDGAVSVWSAHFPWDDDGRNYVHTIPFDHFAQVNWRIPEDRPPNRQEMSEPLKAVYCEIVNNILTVQKSQQRGRPSS